MTNLFPFITVLIQAALEVKTAERNIFPLLIAAFSLLSFFNYFRLRFKNCRIAKRGLIREIKTIRSNQERVSLGLALSSGAIFLVSSALYSTSAQVFLAAWLIYAAAFFASKS